MSIATRRRRWPRVWTGVLLVAVLAVSGAAALYVARQPDGGQAAARAVTIDSPAEPGAANTLRYERLAGPDRTVVRNGGGDIVATLTDGARTSVLAGPARTFAEPAHTTAVINSTVWVRLLPQPWAAGAENQPWFRPWLDKTLADRGPDVLGVAMDYVHGAAAVKDAKGVRVRGDASFGPTAPTGTGRLERSDFYDYLGVGWTFPDAGAVTAEQFRYGSVDCSGFVRLVYGYRLGYPLRGTNAAGPGLPRRAYAIADLGPGVALIRNQQKRATEYELLLPGDLVFFEAEDGEEQIDHSGIYLGTDTDGHYRFVSSRERANGPTFGDLGGTSLLDDGGFYSTGFRAARRI